MRGERSTHGRAERAVADVWSSASSPGYLQTPAELSHAWLQQSWSDLHPPPVEAQVPGKHCFAGLSQRWPTGQSVSCSQSYPGKTQSERLGSQMPYPWQAASLLQLTAG
jgi:hypothetical protein